MNGFPASAEEFYALRDDRTNRCSGRAYQKVSCAVFVGPQVVSTTEGQVMLLVACNLLSRWCRDVTIGLPKTDLHPLLGIGGGDLGEFAVAQMRDADPFGTFQVVERGPGGGRIALCIGEVNCDGSGMVPVFINASGWLAGLSLRQPVDLTGADDRNRLGAIAAACLGVAQVFKIALELPTETLLRSGVFDLFRLDWTQDLSQAVSTTVFNVGRILMVGAGSVGSSAAYCMKLAGLTGFITIVDKDAVKIENFNRSPIFGRATAGLNKAISLAEYLAGSGLFATPVPLWWTQFLQDRGRSSFDFDVWLPLANEFGVRLAMQHNVPPLMVHASTTSNWGVNHGRHVPGRDDCLADRFREEIPAGQLTCATGEVRASEARADAALPFASMFAGLLVSADLVRAQLADYPQVPNFALFDWYGPMASIHAWDRKPRPGCVCREQGIHLHDRFNRNTKYRPLFHLS